MTHTPRDKAIEALHVMATEWSFNAKVYAGAVDALIAAAVAEVERRQAERVNVAAAIGATTDVRLGGATKTSVAAVPVAGERSPDKRGEGARIGPDVPQRDSRRDGALEARAREWFDAPPATYPEDLPSLTALMRAVREEDAAMLDAYAAALDEAKGEWLALVAIRECARRIRSRA